MPRYSALRAVQVAQYEYPAIMAGTLRLRISQIDELIAYHQRQRGNSPMLDTARELCARAVAEAVGLQRVAAAITDNEYAQRILADEKTTELR